MLTFFTSAYTVNNLIRSSPDILLYCREREQVPHIISATGIRAARSCIPARSILRFLVEVHMDLSAVLRAKGQLVLRLIPESGLILALSSAVLGADMPFWTQHEPLSRDAQAMAFDDARGSWRPSNSRNWTAWRSIPRAGSRGRRPSASARSCAPCLSDRPLTPRPGSSTGSSARRSWASSHWSSAPPMAPSCRYRFAWAGRRGSRSQRPLDADAGTIRGEPSSIAA